MSKLSNMLRMVLILNKREFVKISELAETLEVSNRQIRRYRDELEYSGIYIESLTGKNGGYSIQNKNDVFSISSSITKEEDELIRILSQQDFGDIKYLYDIFQKYFEDSDHSYLTHQKTDQLEFACYLFIYDAKKNHKKVKITYMYDMEHNLSVVKTVHPYMTFSKYAQKYLWAYDEYNNKMIKLLLFKIKKWEHTGETFDFDEGLYKQAVMSNQEYVGVYQGDKEYLVKANFNGIERDVIERVLECKVNVTYKSLNNMSVEFKTSSINETRKRLFIFGSKCHVWEPAILSNAIQKEIEEMDILYKNYNNRTTNAALCDSVSNHMQKYIRYNYGEIPYKHVMSKSIPIFDTLLECNRKTFIKYEDEIGELHSPRNFKSSQLMTLDYFLKFKEGNLETLQHSLKINETLLSLSFEKVYPDYTHSDVSIQLGNGSEILIECKYTENRFDYLEEVKEKHHQKFDGVNCELGFVKYDDINKHMLKEKVTKDDFFKNYQLFRNVYNAFNTTSTGYVIVIITKMNSVVDDQFNRFYEDLCNKHGFKYTDRIKKVYWEEIAQLDSEFYGKYLHIKNKRLNIQFTPHSHKILDDTKKQKLLIEVSGYDSKKTLEIADSIYKKYQQEYDILDNSTRHFKKYDDVIDVIIYN